MNSNKEIEMKKDLKVQSDYPTDDYLFIFDNQFTITDFSDALKKVEAHLLLAVKGEWLI